MNTDLPIDQFLGQIIEMVKQFGGISWTLKIASIIALLISTMKVSLIRPLWDKLGWVKGILAPVLGLISGILILSGQGALTFSGAIAYLFAGAGAIVVHELLDAIKGIPGVGGVFLSIIAFFQNLLKKPKEVK